VTDTYLASIRDREACAHLQTLREREAYLRARIVAKRSVGWEYQYDERERVALEWAIRELGGEPIVGNE
jgi:hypothetical protein